MFQVGKKTKLNIFYKRTGKLPQFILENNNVIEIYSDAYDILDLSINRRMYNDLIIMTIGAKNIMNITDINQSGNNNSVHSINNNTVPVGFGRTFFASLKFKI